MKVFKNVLTFTLSLLNGFYVGYLMTGEEPFKYLLPIMVGLITVILLIDE